MISVAIDGPAGAGKSSIAKELAKELKYIYVDTGALYRAVGYYMSVNNIDCANEKAVSDSLSKIKVELKFVNNVQKVFLNDEDVSDKIRTPEMSMCASKVSAIPDVRTFLFDLQRNIAKENNVLMDGRDIGTVVLPNAQVKIFLTASPEARADRRYKEHIEAGQKVDYNTLLKEIIERDKNDSTRKIAPLKQAEDAVLVDTTKLNFNESVEAIKKIILEKIK